MLMAANVYNSRYARLDLESEVSQASPHKLIHMLLSGAIRRLQRGLAAIDKGDLPGKARNLSKALAIVDELRLCLDPTAAATGGGDQGEQLVDRLNELYLYISDRIVLGNAHGDIAVLNEAISLLSVIKEGWEGIASAAESTADDSKPLLAGSV